MGRPKKNPIDMTTEQAMLRLFGKKRLALLKKEVQRLDEEKANKPRGKKRVE
jgi:uncharacterized small protein (DUF1192 family)